MLVVVDDSNRGSSSSGSSDSGSSSSGEESSSSSSGDSPSPLWSVDEMGEHLVVTCAENEAKFYKDKFARGSIGKCVRFKGRWITPNEFQAVSGRQSSKDWKRSIRLNGRCLKDFISEGLFREHLKTCSCTICQGGDDDTRRQEGVLALQAKRRRLSQAGIDNSVGSSGPSYLNQSDDAEGGEGSEESEVEGTVERRLPGSGGMKRKRGRPPKNQRVWSPSGGKNLDPTGTHSCILGT